MSGARLQTVGQVRNALPYIVEKSFSGTLNPITTVPALQVYDKSDIAPNGDIPFDYGPDKSGRVFIAIHGISYLLTADTYAAAAYLVGDLYFLDINGNETHLCCLDDNLTQAKAVNINRMFIPAGAIFSTQPQRIGSIVWKDVASVASTADNVVLRYRFNVGYYGDYAEYDFNQLKKCEHHHYHGVERDELVDMTKV